MKEALEAFALLHPEDLPEHTVAALTAHQQQSLGGGKPTNTPLPSSQSVSALLQDGTGLSLSSLFQGQGGKAAAAAAVVGGGGGEEKDGNAGDGGASHHGSTDNNTIAAAGGAAMYSDHPPLPPSFEEAVVAAVVGAVDGLAAGKKVMVLVDSSINGDSATAPSSSLAKALSKVCGTSGGQVGVADVNMFMMSAAAAGGSGSTNEAEVFMSKMSAEEDESEAAKEDKDALAGFDHVVWTFGGGLQGLIAGGVAAGDLGGEESRAVRLIGCVRGMLKPGAGSLHMPVRRSWQVTCLRDSVVGGLVNGKGCNLSSGEQDSEWTMVTAFAPSYQPGASFSLRSRKKAAGAGPE